MPESKKFSLFHILVLIILGGIASSTYSSAAEKDGLLKIHFFDIGQGDSIFIEAPNGSQVLVDGGPDGSVIQKLSAVMPFYDKEIDLIVLSHAHADHVTGLVEVLKRYNVKNIITADISYESGEFAAWQEGIKSEGANIVDAVAGNYTDLGNGVRLETIHPFTSPGGITTKDPHNFMVVNILKYGDFELLLTGDLESKEERAIMANGIKIDSDILKVGHHGSKTSSADYFLEAVSPQLAIISLGAKNRYGHPHISVTDRLESFGIKYYRTDSDGDITVVSDSKNFKVIND